MTTHAIARLSGCQPGTRVDQKHKVVQDFDNSIIVVVLCVGLRGTYSRPRDLESDSLLVCAANTIRLWLRPACDDPCCCSPRCYQAGCLQTFCVIFKLFSCLHVNFPIGPKHVFFTKNPIMSLPYTRSEYGISVQVRPEDSIPQFLAGISRIGPRVDNDRTGGSIRGPCQPSP